MSSINLSTDVPDQIALLEQIHAWSALALYNLHRGRTYQEADGGIGSGLSPLVDVSVVTAADKSIRMIVRSALELDPSYVTDGTQKLWMFARELGDTVIPAAYLDN